jgi:cell division initiation protein
MTLSPADVEQKTFSTALRGYDLDEVDDFLDEIVATIKELSDQLAAAKQAAAAVTVESAGRGEVPDESAVGRALITAQETADQIVADARREAERIVQEADTEAETLQSEKERRKAEAEAEMAELSERVAGVRAQLAVLATSVADRLDEMDESLRMPPDEMAEGADESNDGELSGRRPEVGKHTGVSDHVDISDDVESFVLDEEDTAQDGPEQTEAAETSEKTW